MHNFILEVEFLQVLSFKKSQNWFYFHLKKKNLSNLAQKFCFESFILYYCCVQEFIVA